MQKDPTGASSGNALILLKIIFGKYNERAESIAFDLLSMIPGLGRRRKRLEKYKYSATSAIG